MEFIWFVIVIITIIIIRLSFIGFEEDDCDIFITP